MSLPLSLIQSHSYLSLYLSDTQTVMHLSCSLRQLPADSSDVSCVGGEPLLAVIQGAALCRLLDFEPQ